MKTLRTVLVEMAKTFAGVLVLIVGLWAGAAIAAVLWTVVQAGWQFGLGPVR